MAHEEHNRVTASGDVPDATSEPSGLGGDLFYHGTILRVFPKKNKGIVRTSSGREVPFSYELVELSGPVKHPRELREDLVVGYDMGWTSSGLRVTKIRTYRRSPEERAQDAVAGTAAEGDSEGQQR